MPSRCAVTASASVIARFGVMSTILVGVTAIVIFAFAVMLAVLRAGVWQQEHAGSLTRRPRRVSAAIARRVFGLSARLPERAVERSAEPTRKAR